MFTSACLSLRFFFLCLSWLFVCVYFFLYISVSFSPYLLSTSTTFVLLLPLIFIFISPHFFFFFLRLLLLVFHVSNECTLCCNYAVLVLKNIQVELLLYSFLSGIPGVYDKAQTSPHVSAQIMAIDDSDGFHEIIWRSPDTATTETRLQTQPATDEVSFAGGLEASGTERDRTYSPPPLKSSTSHTLHIYDDEQCENLPSDNTTPHQASVSPPSSPQTTLLEELTSHLQDDSGFFDTSLSLNDSHINTPSSQSQGRTLHSTRRAFHQANSCDLSQRLEETVTSSVREVSLAGSSSSGTHQHSREERSLLFTPLAHTNSSCVDNASDIVVSTQQTEKHANPRNVTFQSTPNEKSLSNSTRGCSRSAYQDSRREDKSSKSCSEDLSTASEQSNKEVYNGAECSTTWVDYLESHSETSPDPGHDLQVEGPAVRDNEVSDRHSSEDDTQDMGGNKFDLLELFNLLNSLT